MDPDEPLLTLIEETELEQLREQCAQQQARLEAIESVCPRRANAPFWDLIERIANSLRARG